MRLRFVPACSLSDEQSTSRCLAEMTLQSVTQTFSNLNLMYQTQFKMFIMSVYFVRGQTVTSKQEAFS